MNMVNSSPKEQQKSPLIKKDLLLKAFLVEKARPKKLEVAK